MLLARLTAAIYVDHVGCGLEGVKGNADGEHDREKSARALAAERLNGVVNGLIEKGKVFEKEQNAEARHKRYGEDKTTKMPSLARPIQKPSAQVGHRRCEGNEEHKTRIPIHIKEVGCREQGQISPFMRCQPIQKEGDRQENQKFKRVE